MPPSDLLRPAFSWSSHWRPARAPEYRQVTYPATVLMTLSAATRPPRRFRLREVDGALPDRAPELEDQRGRDSVRGLEALHTARLALCDVAGWGTTQAYRSAARDAVEDQVHDREPASASSTGKPLSRSSLAYSSTLSILSTCPGSVGGRPCDGAAARAPDDELRGQHDVTRRASGSARRSRSTSTARRPISSAGWAATVRKGKVTMARGRLIEPHDRHVVGDSEAELLEHVQDADGDEVVGSEERRGTQRCLNHGQRHGMTALDGEGAVHDLRRRQAGLVHERTAESRDAVDRGRDRCRSRQHGHAAMAQAHEQPAEPSAPPSESARTTSTPGACGRRSTTTSGTPWSRHR